MIRIRRALHACMCPHSAYLALIGKRGGDVPGQPINIWASRRGLGSVVYDWITYGYIRVEVVLVKYRFGSVRFDYFVFFCCLGRD